MSFYGTQYDYYDPNYQYLNDQYLEQPEEIYNPNLYELSQIAAQILGHHSN